MREGGRGKSRRGKGGLVERRGGRARESESYILKESAPPSSPHFSGGGAVKFSATHTL